METALQDNDAFLSRTFRHHLLPAILSVAGVTASTMANSLVAGNLLGHEALAVMSVVSPIYFIFATVGALVGVGGASVAAWATGHEDPGGVDRAFTFSCILITAISLALTALGLLFLDPFVRMLGASEALAPLCRQYAFWFLLGGVGTAGIYLPFNFLKLEGRLRISILLFLSMAAMNIGLDFLLVMVFDLGIVGIAMATSLSALTAFAIGMLCLLGKKSSFSLCPVKGHWRESLTLLKSGSPASLNNLSNTMRTLCLNLILFPLAGSLGLSVFSIVTTAANLALTVISGAGQTTAPFVGVFVHERDNASIRQLERKALTLGTLLVAVVAALFALFARPFCGLFGVTDPQVLVLSTQAVMLFSLSLVPSLISTVLLNYYQASGNTAIANIFTLCRAFGFVVLGAFLLSRFMGLPGVWLAFTLAELLSWGVLWLILAISRKLHPEQRGLFLLDRRYEESGTYISFSVLSQEEDIMNASTKISEFCEHNQLDTRRSMLISLALEEMLISISSHCFQDGKLQEMNVRIIIVPDEVRGEHVIVLRIRCSGTPFNPIAYYESCRQENPDEFDDSVGIKMIVKSAHSVDYKSTFGINNLTIIL
ncbi:MAG: MATE family efflux transporter [Oscillospiraceae bacterium]